MKWFGRVMVTGVVGFLLLQLLRPAIPTPAATAEVQVPPEVKRILNKDCYACHSNERRLAWYDEIVPAYWLARGDILVARQHLNFSTLGSRPAAAQRARLFESVNMIQLGAMPVGRYLALHPEARVTQAELATLEAYLKPWSALPDAEGSTGGTTGALPGEIAAAVAIDSGRPEPNGFAIEPGFEGWRLISATDRGDNNSLRLILGNDVAFKAARAGAITPWPEGAMFAKIAWRQQSGPDGLVHPGRFIQVELMKKGKKEFHGTEGWEWGRWRGLDLRPYGEGPEFVNECTGCHQPMHRNDYVYTMPITAAKVSGDTVVNNRAAGLGPGLAYQPLDWGAITLFVDPEKKTVSVLLGNDVAMRSVRALDREAAAKRVPMYEEGSVVALVTWAEGEDPHWFGARIPDVPQKVEFVEVGAGGKKNKYARFVGGKAQDEGAKEGEARAKVMLGLEAAQLP
jgi:Haem-binding domain/Cytochrome P460